MQQNQFIKNISEAAEYSPDSNIYQKPLKNIIESNYSPRLLFY
jgi:hypothetical protein